MGKNLLKYYNSEYDDKIIRKAIISNISIDGKIKTQNNRTKIKLVSYSS